MPSIYIPVSLRDEIVLNKCNYLHQILNIEENKKIVLYFGTIAENRIHISLIESLIELDDSFVIVLHGYINESMEQKITKEFTKSKVIISTGFVPESEVSKVIASAYIGLALYTEKHENDTLTAFSSEKVTRYCQCGVPFISFNNVSYQKLFSEYSCGKMINNYLEICNAIKIIDKNYQEYHQNAWEAYSKHFYFNNYSELLLNTLSDINYRTATL